ncbi:AAA family ATPase [Flavobacterium album]|uniref:AAA family ATPase n=1 Tax=Flavobacterium album TaxID=2175091 RepID=A0A2S1QVF0_9FLAO|nr:ATP-binding protein [Flavobacterium album]AWH84346.1 AAA family ATPase [Flavobacterium album]
MINKRLLIKNLLAHNDESSFYDKKRQLNLHTKEGKGKFVKHICALSNSNPSNNSYIVVGVEDHDNEITGTDFYDDSRIQNLVNAYLENPPTIQYENVPFPSLSKDKVIGLVTIHPKQNHKPSYFKKAVYTIPAGAVFVRRGSNSMPAEIENVFDESPANADVVAQIENGSRNSIEHTLEGVMDFITNRHKDMTAKYKVFQELFIVCWAGNKKVVKGKTYFSRVDIELINEQVKLFYSALDEVSIDYTDDSFSITEYVALGLNDKTSYYPLEEVSIRFKENGYYNIESTLLFEPPQFNRNVMHHIYNSTLVLLDKLQKGVPLSEREEKDIYNLPSTLMICYLNDFTDAKRRLIDAKPLLKAYPDASVYVSFKEAMRILRKMKYDRID